MYMPRQIPKPQRARHGYVQHARGYDVFGNSVSLVGRATFSPSFVERQSYLLSADTCSVAS